MNVTAGKSQPNAMSRGRRRSMVVAVVGAALLLGACSDEDLPADTTRPDEPLLTLPEGDAPGAPAPEPTDVPAPAPTDAPAPAPTDAPAPQPTEAPSEPVTSEPEGDGATAEETIAIILLIVALVGLVLGLVAWLTPRSKGSAVATADLHPKLVSISTRSRWLADQAVPTLLATTDPAALQAAWGPMSSNLNTLQGELTDVAGRIDVDASAALTELGTSVAAMRGALEYGYQMRLQHLTDPELVTPSDQAILAQSDRLRRAIQAFEYATA
jgi:hypothetical protein